MGSSERNFLKTEKTPEELFKMGNLDRSKVNVKVTSILPFSYAESNTKGFVLMWEGNIGFGEYTIYTRDNAWYGDSEAMDHGDDKWFIKKLMESFIEQLEVHD